MNASFLVDLKYFAWQNVKLASNELSLNKGITSYCQILFKFKLRNS